MRRQPALFPKIMDAHMDMVLVALRSGVTRVATLQLANRLGQPLNFGAFVRRGIPATRHRLQERVPQLARPGHNPSMGGINHKIIVDKWCMDKFAGFLDQG